MLLYMWRTLPEKWRFHVGWIAWCCHFTWMRAKISSLNHKSGQWFRVQPYWSTIARNIWLSWEDHRFSDWSRIEIRYPLKVLYMSMRRRCIKKIGLILLVRLILVINIPQERIAHSGLQSPLWQGRIWFSLMKMKMATPYSLNCRRWTWNCRTRKKW